jgi:hypothetical protein
MFWSIWPTSGVKISSGETAAVSPSLRKIQIADV